jgi:hypothetical protein
LLDSGQVHMWELEVSEPRGQVQKWHMPRLSEFSFRFPDKHFILRSMILRMPVLPPRFRLDHLSGMIRHLYRNLPLEFTTSWRA